MTREERENALHCLRVMVEEEVCEECELYGTTGTDHCEADCVRVAIEALKKEPKTGHWIKEESPYGWDGHSYQCSECGRSIHLDTEMEDLEDYPYCHCGAKMQEVQE